jgi:hypothetical protein
VTLTLTVQNLKIPESQFSKHGGVRPSYGAKATADCRFLELMKFQYLPEMEKSGIFVNFIRQNHMTNLLAAKNDSMLLL